MLKSTDHHTEPASPRNRGRNWVGAALLGAVIAAVGAPHADAIPLYAQRYATSCTACHSIPPKLNQGGLAFKANGYRLPPGIEPQRSSATVPFSTWITGRFEDRASPGPSDSFLPKVELIAGGPIGEQLSYFVEWRVVSQSLRGDGTFQDRGGAASRTSSSNGTSPTVTPSPSASSGASTRSMCHAGSRRRNRCCSATACRRARATIRTAGSRRCRVSRRRHAHPASATRSSP